MFLLTVLAGVSRFVALDHPPIWGDEAATFRRVCGTYQQLLDTLRDEPFAPLHYEAEWALRQYHPLTPFWLRLFPAICSTLSVPAMYFVARQLVRVKTALLAATFTLCSAWMINYGRDAKMYGEFWLFVILFAGALFCWLRTHTWTSWLCWIAAGCAMTGLNMWGFCLVAMAPLFLLTARRVHWVMGPALLIGMTIVASGSVGYYTLFNRWTDRASHSSGLANVEWIPWRNQDKGGLELIQDTSSSFLACYTFIQEGIGNVRPHSTNAVFVGATCGFTGAAALLVIGLLPWRNRLRRRAIASTSRAGAGPPFARARAVDPLAAAMLGQSIRREDVLPHWEEEDEFTPLVPARRTNGGHQAAIALAFGGRDEPQPRRRFWQRRKRSGNGAQSTSLAAHDVTPEPWWRVTLWLSVWIALPLYVFYCLSLPHSETPLDWLTNLRAWAGGNLWVMGSIVLAGAVVMTFFPLVARIAMAAVILVAGGTLLCSLWPAFRDAVHGPAAEQWHWPIDGINTWLGWLVTPRLAVPTILLICTVTLARCATTWPRRAIRIVQLAIVIAIVGGLLYGTHAACGVVLANAKERNVHMSSIWLPRYQGFVWPAFAIAVSALLMRLPTRPLRWAAILALLAVNVAAADARIFGQTEPPVDRLVVDVQTASDSAGHTRLFIGPPNAITGFGPSGGRVDDEVGRYYLLMNEPKLSPGEFTDKHVFSLNGVRHTTRPDAIERNATQADVKRLIVWNADIRPADGSPIPAATDTLLPKLGPHWKCVSEQFYSIKYFWCWGERYVFYRRDYERAGPSTMPSDLHAGPTAR